MDLTDPGRPLVRLYERATAPIGEPIPLSSYSGGIDITDGKTLAVGNGDVLELRDTRTGQLLRDLHGHNGAITDIVFAGPNGDLLWTAGRDGTAIAWDLSGLRGVLHTTTGSSTAWLGDTAATGEHRRRPHPARRPGRRYLPAEPPHRRRNPPETADAHRMHLV